MGRDITGAVWKDHGKWRVQFTSKHRRWSSVVPPRRDGRPITEIYAKDYVARLVEKFKSNEWDPWADPDAMRPVDQTVIDYLRAWIRQRTHHTRKDDSNRIERYIARTMFGNMLLREVRPKHVADFIDRVKARESIRGETLAPRTVRNIYSVIQRAFARAALDEVFAVSPCETVSKAGILPKRDDKNPGERVTWKYTRREAAMLIYDERLPEDRRVTYAIALLGGLRFGESSALRVSDYDKACTPLRRITAGRSYQSATKKIKGTKTGAIKFVPVIPALAEILDAWLEHGFRKRFKRDPQPGDLLVPNREGRARSSNSGFRALERDCTKLGIPQRAMKQHGMRHTFVTLARADGALGERLRWVTHAPPKSMLDQYTSPDWEALCAEVSKLKIDRSALSSARADDANKEDGG